MSENADDELEAGRLREPLVEKAEHYETLRTAAETAEAPAVKTKAEAVEEILLKLSGGDADYGIEPRDGGFAFVKTVSPVDDRLDHYGVPAQEPLVWAPTLEGIQDRILLLDDAASIAARTGAAEWSEETIKADPWTAVYLPPPDLERTDIAVLRKGLIAARECADSADDGLAGEMAEARTVLLAETIMGRIERAGIAAEMAESIVQPANQNERDAVIAATEAPRQETATEAVERGEPEAGPTTAEAVPRPANGQQRGAEEVVFSFESIARDPWSAVNDAIPEAPSDELLVAAREAVARCIDESIPAGPLRQSSAPPVEGADRDFGAAMNRDEALYEIARARELERQPMTVEAIEADPWNAVIRDLPADGPRELYEAVIDAAVKLRDGPVEVLESAPWPFSPASDDDWAELGDRIKSRLQDADVKLREIDGLTAAAPPKQPEPGEAPAVSMIYEAPEDARRPQVREPTAMASAAGEGEAEALAAIEPSPGAGNILSPLFIARSVTEHLARAAELVLNVVVDYFVDEPKMTGQQIHDTLQARGNVETIHAQEVAAAAQEDRVAYEARALGEKSAQQEKDLYLSMVLGGPATAEAHVAVFDQYDRQREEQRSQDESEGQQYRGRHL